MSDTNNNLGNALALMGSACDELQTIIKDYADVDQGDVACRVDWALTRLGYAIGFLNNERQGV